MKKINHESPKQRREIGLGGIVWIIGVFFLTLYITHESPDSATDVTSGIPVLLNASCTAWVDHQGQQISVEEANAFFQQQPSAGKAIIKLNADHRYATRLYSSERAQFLNEIYHTFCDEYSTTTENQESLLSAYEFVLEENRPNESSLDLLSKHLIDDYTTQATVRQIRYDCINSNGITTPVDQRDTVNRIFFACLAKYSEDGTVDQLCDVSNPSIPVVVSEDGIWQDQNGHAIATETAHAYFEKHRGYAHLIGHYNDHCNPHAQESLNAGRETAHCDSLCVSAQDFAVNSLNYLQVVNGAIADPLDIEAIRIVDSYMTVIDAKKHSDGYSNAMRVASGDLLKIAESDEAKMYGYVNHDDSWYSDEIRILFNIALSRMSSMHQEMELAVKAAEEERTARLVKLRTNAVMDAIIDIASTQSESESESESEQIANQQIANFIEATQEISEEADLHAKRTTTSDEDRLTSDMQPHIGSGSDIDNPPKPD